MDEKVKAQIAMLVQAKGEKLPTLKTIEGIDTHIPHGRTVEDPDAHPELLWERPNDPSLDFR
ncbi:hypothetical protein BDV26DRAFT_261865 [Aspergillus bertholletiae]|uniref:Uncharacterized protein n=1 Tax=Aspergillus bertholletiae TaxID=1226010 RepID=A0A5N7B937_9EURO|nr:hypothetical protein BDV26DRAFT_261865 [Aspergillus bertholletiae]